MSCLNSPATPQSQVLKVDISKQVIKLICTSDGGKDRRFGMIKGSASKKIENESLKTVKKISSVDRPLQKKI